MASVILCLCIPGGEPRASVLSGGWEKKPIGRLTGYYSDLSDDIIFTRFAQANRSTVLQFVIDWLLKLGPDRGLYT